MGIILCVGSRQVLTGYLELLHLFSIWTRTLYSIGSISIKILLMLLPFRVVLMSLTQATISMQAFLEPALLRVLKLLLLLNLTEMMDRLFT